MNRHACLARPPAQEVRRSLWPEQAAQPEFIAHLRRLYDETQLEAIEVGAVLECGWCGEGSCRAAEGEGGGQRRVPARAQDALLPVATGPNAIQASRIILKQPQPLQAPR